MMYPIIREAERHPSINYELKTTTTMKNVKAVLLALMSLSSSRSSSSSEAFVFVPLQHRFQHHQKTRVPPLYSTIKDSSRTQNVTNTSSSSSGALKKEHAAFKAWPEERIVANGDYGEQMWLEELIGGPLYSAQTKLPSLPVPDLQDTVLKLLSSGLPLAQNKREKQYFGAACHFFPEQAQVLQERLVEHANKCNEAGVSWLQKLWQTQGYLQVRDPLSPCVSYFLFVPDDDTLPSAEENNKGLKRAAAALYAMAEARQQVCSGQLPSEVIATTPETPLCSTGFKYLFHATRIPQRTQDCYHMYDPSKYSHVVVATKGQFFQMEFVDPVTADPLSLPVLEARLQQCQEMAANNSGSSSIEMGWLTSLNRDVWADARQELLEKGGDKMTKAFETLESGAFVLNLDDDVSLLWVIIYLLGMAFYFANTFSALAYHCQY